MRYSSTPCFLRPPFFSADDGKEANDGGDGGAGFSVDCTRVRRGERGRVIGGEECSLAGKVGVALGVLGEGVCASGDRGTLPADLQRDERNWRCSLGDRPCRELGRM